MKTNQQSKFGENQLVIFKDETWLANQKHAGRCVAACLKNCGDAIKSGEPGLNVLDLVKICERQFEIFNCEPTFYNYKGHSNIPFPSKICVSINEQIVHGIASDRLLKEGDVVSIDLGASYAGNNCKPEDFKYKAAVSDAARTYIYKNPISEKHIDLIKACWGALNAGINNIKIDERVGNIGYAINNFTKNYSYGLIINYGGHGIGGFGDKTSAPHCDPFISNKDRPENGVRIQNNMSFAIEPMLTLDGLTKTEVLNDEWTVISSSKSVSAHFENTISIINNEIHNVTEVMYEQY